MNDVVCNDQYLYAALDGGWLSAEDMLGCTLVSRVWHGVIWRLYVKNLSWRSVAKFRGTIAAIEKYALWEVPRTLEIRLSTCALVLHRAYKDLVDHDHVHFFHNRRTMSIGASRNVTRTTDEVVLMEHVLPLLVRFTGLIELDMNDCGFEVTTGDYENHTHLFRLSPTVQVLRGMMFSSSVCTLLFNAARFLPRLRVVEIGVPTHASWGKTLEVIKRHKRQLDMICHDCYYESQSEYAVWQDSACSEFADEEESALQVYRNELVQYRETGFVTRHVLFSGWETQNLEHLALPGCLSISAEALCTITENNRKLPGGLDLATVTNLV